jgi:hypothetical protein
MVRAAGLEKIAADLAVPAPAGRTAQVGRVARVAVDPVMGGRVVVAVAADAKADRRPWTDSSRTRCPSMPTATASSAEPS